jgi:hypothetical protein
MAGVGGFGGDSRDEWASREGGGQQVGHNSVRAHADVTQRGGALKQVGSGSQVWLMGPAHDEIKFLFFRKGFLFNAELDRNLGKILRGLRKYENFLKID